MRWKKFLLHHWFITLVFVGVCLALWLVFSVSTTHVFRSHPSEAQEVIKGKVLSTTTLSKQQDRFQTFVTQKMSVKITEKSGEITVPVEYESDSTARLPLKPGDVILLSKIIADGNTTYHYSDLYRLDRLYVVIIGFCLLVILIAGRRGFGSLFGLAMSMVIIFVYIVPQIFAGNDPFLVSIIGASLILFFSSYPAHGISKQTTVALGAMIIVMVAMLFLSKFLIWFTMLTGYSNEEAFGIAAANNHILQLKSLLIGGIIIATVGGLDDVTTAQAAAVFQLAKAKPDLSIAELFRRGMAIGQEHVISLINTLVIAFVGSSFTFFVSLFVFYSYESVWVVLNRELLAEELVKSVAISSGLILAVPIVTALAAYVAKKK
jgi:uncharacterized membrane protein